MKTASNYHHSLWSWTGTHKQLLAGSPLAAPSREDSLISAVYMLVTSRLDRCTTVFMRLPWKIVQKFEFIQNLIASLLSGSSHVLLSFFGYFNSCQNITKLPFKALVLPFKTVNSLGPDYHKDHPDLGPIFKNYIFSASKALPSWILFCCYNSLISR